MDIVSLTMDTNLDITVVVILALFTFDTYTSGLWSEVYNLNITVI